MLTVMSNRSPPSTYCATMVSRTSTRRSGGHLDVVDQDPGLGTGICIGHRESSLRIQTILGIRSTRPGISCARRVDVVGDGDVPPLAWVLVEQRRDRADRVADLDHIEFGQVGRVRLVLLQLFFGQRELE